MIKRYYILAFACAFAVVFNLFVSSYMQGGTFLRGVFFIFTPYIVFALAILYYSLHQATTQSFFKIFFHSALFLALYHFAFKIIWLEIGANQRGASVSDTVYLGIAMFYLISIPVVALLVYAPRWWVKKVNSQSSLKLTE